MQDLNILLSLIFSLTLEIIAYHFEFALFLKIKLVIHMGTKLPKLFLTSQQSRGQYHQQLWFQATLRLLRKL